MQHAQPSADAVRITDNPERSRYEMSVDGRLAAFCDYRREAGALRLVHTEVDEAFEGQGLGSRLAAHVLDDARRQGLKVVPQCPFIAAYVARHEREYAGLVRH